MHHAGDGRAALHLLSVGVSAAKKRSWLILTGEYPPHVGGVSTSTHQVAMALAAGGDRVEVWAPSDRGEERDDPGVTFRRLPDHFGPRTLQLLDREVGGRGDVRLLVQFVPHAFGMRAMNVPFCAWVAARGRPFWVMFHEVAFPFRRTAPLRHNFLAAVNTAMAALLTRSAEVSLVSTSAWTPFLRRIAPRAPEPVWMPIPSTLPEEVDRALVAKARRELGIAPDRVVIGSFGTHGGQVATLLSATLPPLLAADSRRVVLLIGKGSQELAERTFGSTSAGRVFATGQRAPESLAAHVALPDVMVQPYPDGVSTRRGSTMASVALGTPVVTNRGHNTEPIWEGGVSLAPDPSAASLVAATEIVLGPNGRRAELGAAGRALYERRFSMDCTVRTLRACADRLAEQDGDG